MIKVLLPYRAVLSRGPVRMLALAAMACALLALSAGSASAAPGYQSAGSFGGPGTGNGQFDHPQGIAIDSTGKLLVVDRDESRIQVFSLDGSGGGTYLSKFGASVLDHPYGIAVDQASGDIYVSDAGLNRIVRFDSSYALDAGYTSPVQSSDPTVGVTSFDSSIAIDQTDHSLLVADHGSNHVIRFNGSGAHVDDFNGADSPGDPDGRFTGLRDIAVDATGRILVVDTNGVDPELGGGAASRLLRFTSAGAYDDSPGALTNPGAVTADPATHDARVIADLAVSANPNLYTLVGDTVASSLAAFPADNQRHSSPRSMTIDGVNGLLYVSTTVEPLFLLGRPSIQVYKPAIIATTAPSASLDAVSGPATEAVTLHGRVNPNGFQTSYRFEYRAAGAADWVATPVPDGDAADGVTDVDVHADLSGLTPAQPYEYRLIATNGAGVTESATGTFTTPGAPPVATTTPATSVETESARLVGAVNPRHQITTYHFEYGPTAGYGATTPTTDVGAGNVSKSADTVVHDLQPGTTYHFRLVATNATGTATGVDRTFTTSAVDGAGKRAYEMVSPPDKNGIGVTATPTNTGSYLAPDGNTVMFSAQGAFAGAVSAPGFGRYLARRSSTGWSTTSIDPPNLTDTTFLRVQLTYGTSEDGLRAIVYSNKKLAPGGVDNTPNLYMRDNRTGAYTLIISDPRLGNGSDQAQSLFIGLMTPDLSTLIITNNVEGNLTPDLPDAGQYVWREGKGLSRLQVQPEGEAVPMGMVARAVSPDGRRIVAQLVQSTYSFSGALYLLEDGRPPVQISASQRTGDDPTALHLASFQGASRDVSKILFQGYDELTDASDTNGGDIDSPTIYEFDVRTGTLTDLLADVPSEGRGVTSGTNTSAEVSHDGSTLYFTATGAFRPGAIAGHANLYVARHGSIRFVSDLRQEPLNPGYTSQVSTDGRYLTLQVGTQLTAYDTQGCAGRSCVEIYVYDAETASMSCASCNPGGLPPGDDSNFVKNQVPLQWQQYENKLTDDGRVSFETRDALLPQDVNNKRDVYTWKDGELSLVSTGTNDADALFESMSADGASIAFATEGRLVGQDTDSVADIYVARIGGGFASQAGPPPAPSPCADDGCQAPPAASAPASPIGSITFTGFGNAPAPGPSKPATVTVSKLKTVTGTTATVKIKVPASGAIRVSGASIVKVAKSMSGAGTASVKLRLTAKAQKALKRKRSLRAAVTVTFTPEAGAPVSKKLTVTFKRPAGTKRGARS